MYMAFMASTPPSTKSSPSIGGSSEHGTTPGTVLTQISPCAPRYSTNGSEDFHNDAIAVEVFSESAIGRAKRPVAHFPEGLPTYPVRAASFKLHTPAKLSPTAASFTPRHLDNSVEDHIEVADSVHLGGNHFEPYSRSQSRSYEANHALAAVHKNSSSTGRNSPDFDRIVNTPQPGIGSKIWSATLDAGAIDLERVTRYIEISGVSKALVLDTLTTALKGKSFNPPNLVIITELATCGVIYLHFTDIRDSRIAFSQLQVTFPGWQLRFIAKSNVANFQNAAGAPKESITDGRLEVSAICEGNQRAYDIQTVAHVMKCYLETFGDLQGWRVISTKFPCLTMLVNYYDTQAVERAVTSTNFNYNGIKVSVRVSASEHSPSQFHSLHAYANENRAVLEPQNLLERSTTQYDHPRVGGKLHTYEEESSQNLTVSDMFDNRGNSARLPLNNVHRYGQAVRMHRSQGDGPYSQHNVVDIDRIRLGVDVRTTVMLRNIPNKINQAMLKEILDETSRGKYDFMYLRIDFANNCNVGYAFINFEDPWYIIDFVKARAGCRWNRFHSDKVAEVSYATIQGKDCLIQKFRNSSVMMEHPSFRPKIFRAGTGHEAGLEEPFPGPDNTSKMRRSVENAEHVGLFAPRGAQLQREEQRRRRSQYDRGTRHAELEGY